MPKFKQKPMEPTQLMMFATSVEDSVPQDSDVRMLSDVMDRLDWSGFEAGYAETGCPAYPPKVLCKVLVYGYSKGIRSSRALEDAVKNDKRYIWIAGGLEPDHCTISRFRKDKEPELRAMFTDSVRVCTEVGLVLLNTVSVDGSRIAARASKRSLYNKKRAAREAEAIDRILKEAEEADRREDELYGNDSGRKLPEELADAAKRKQKIEEITRRLKASGRRSVSATDEECRVMRTANGLGPAYNVQIGVDSSNGIIVAADVTDSETDSGQLGGVLEEVVQNTGCKPDLALADTGYSGEQTYKYLEESGQEALIPVKTQPQQKNWNDLFGSRNFMQDEEKDVLICPVGRELTFRQELRCGSGTYREYTACGCKDCSFYRECVPPKCKTGRSIRISVVARTRKEMIEKLKTPEGRAAYALRRQTVETVFANTKSNMKLNRFMLDGKAGASSEWWLICTAHNLKKCASTWVQSSVSCLCSVQLARYLLPATLWRIVGPSQPRIHSTPA